jgi:hypothetical protein
MPRHPRAIREDLRMASTLYKDYKDYLIISIATQNQDILRWKLFIEISIHSDSMKISDEPRLDS